MPVAAAPPCPATALAVGGAPASGMPGHLIDLPQGNGAFAFFSTLPSDPTAIQSHQPYTDTFILPCQQAAEQNDQRPYDNPVHLDQASYMFDRRGGYVAVSTTSGHAEGSTVEFTLAGNLVQAKLRATVPVQTRTTGADGRPSCKEASRELNVAWAAYGGMLGSGKRLYRYSSDRFRWVLH
ncbi:MAG: hypothetical protein ACREX8_14865, partial [Gammaproteobacteria bacterium]